MRRGFSPSSLLFALCVLLLITAQAHADDRNVTDSSSTQMAALTPTNEHHSVPTGNALHLTAQPDTEQTLLGKWRSNDAVYIDGQIQVFMTLEFKSPSHATIASECHYTDGKNLEAAVNVDVDIDETWIAVLNDADSFVTEGSHGCPVHMVKGAVPYVFGEGKLTLASMNSAPLTFSRHGVSSTTTLQQP